MVIIKKNVRARFKIICEDRDGIEGMKMRQIVFDDGKDITDVDALYKKLEECVKKL